MKKLILSLVLALTVLSPLSTIGVNTAKAGAYLTTNSAIRGTSVDTVYWYATDGKRYVFPNAQSFYSWFPNFNNVSVITDAELYAITIGGNVTFRPGAKLVKVNTDPRVYAVSRGGVLRHVTSEYLATQLYGSDWNTKVADIADVYFTNYTVGTPIYNAYDYNVSNEYNGVTTPSDSLRSQGQSPVFTLEADRTSITSGQPVVLTARANFGRDYLGQLAPAWIEIRNANGTVLKRCSPLATICSVTVYPTQTNGQTSVMYNAYTDNGTWAPLNIYLNGSSTQFSSGSSSLEANRTTANVGETVTLTARATNLNTVESNIRMELYRESNSSLVDTCYDHATCTFNVTVTNDNSNAVRYYVIVKNDANEQIPAAYSSRITVSGTSTGTMVLTANRTTVASGETITLSATGASAWNTSRIVLVNEQNGAIIANCYSVSTCSQNVTVTGYNGETIRYRAESRDWSGAILATAYVSVYVTGTQIADSVTLTSNKTTARNENVTLTAYAGYGGTGAFNGYRMEVSKEIGSGSTYVGACTITNSASCTLDAYVSATDFSPFRFYVLMKNASGQQAGSAWSQYITVSSSGTSNNGTNYINGLVLNADRTSINSGELVHLTANAFNSGTWSYIGNRIEISSVNTGQILRTCYDVATCTLDVYPQARSATNLTAQYQTRIYDRTGTLAMSQFGPVIYINGSGTTGTGSVGQSVTVPTSYLNMIPSGGRVVIKRANNIVTTCYRNSSCTIPVSAYQYYHTNETKFMVTVYGANGEIQNEFSVPVFFDEITTNAIRYTAYIYDRNGQHVTSQSGSTTSMNGTGSVSYGPTENLRTNRMMYLTTTFLNSNVAVADAKVELYVENLSTPLATCLGSYTCAVSYATGATPVSTRVYARLSNRNNASQWLETPRVALVTTW